MPILPSILARRPLASLLPIAATTSCTAVIVVVIPIRLILVADGVFEFLLLLGEVHHFLLNLLISLYHTPLVLHLN